VLYGDNELFTTSNLLQVSAEGVDLRRRITYLAHWETIMYKCGLLFDVNLFQDGTQAYAFGGNCYLSGNNKSEEGSALFTFSKHHIICALSAKFRAVLYKLTPKKLSGNRRGGFAPELSLQFHCGFVGLNCFDYLRQLLDFLG